MPIAVSDEPFTLKAEVSISLAELSWSLTRVAKFNLYANQKS